MPGARSPPPACLHFTLPVRISVTVQYIFAAGKPFAYGAAGGKARSQCRSAAMIFFCRFGARISHPSSASGRFQILRAPVVTRLCGGAAWLPTVPDQSPGFWLFPVVGQATNHGGISKIPLPSDPQVRHRHDHLLAFIAALYQHQRSRLNVH